MTDFKAEKFSAWIDAKQAYEEAEKIASRAQTSLLNAQADLAKQLLPHDAKPGEKFGIWVLGALVMVEVPELPPSSRDQSENQAPKPVHVYIRTQTK